MKIKLTAFVCATIFISACGSADDSDKQINDNDLIGLEEGPGEVPADFKTSDEFFTLTETYVKTAPPHNLVRIWYSSNVKDLIGEENFVVPKGTVSVKEFYPSGEQSGNPVTVVMIKKEKDYNSEHQDWYFSKISPAGEVLAEGKGEPVKGCQSCHSAFAGKDYLGGTWVK